MREIMRRLLFQYFILCRIVGNFDVKNSLLIRGMQIGSEINRPSLRRYNNFGKIINNELHLIAKKSGWILRG